MQVGFDVTVNFPSEEGDGFEMSGELFCTLNFRTGENGADGAFALYGNMQNAPHPNTFVQAYFHANPDEWSFKMGAPEYNYNDNNDPRGSAHLSLAGLLNMDIKTYMMIGNDVPTQLPPLPPPIFNILNNPSGDAEAESVTAAQNGIDPSEIESGSGFAHGLYAEIVSDIDAFLLYARLGIYLGYDINMTQRNTPCANTGELPGINGFYSEGQIYAGLEGGMGIRIKILGKEREFELFELRAALALRGGGPKPFYFQGQASVYYTCLLYTSPSPRDA